MRSCRRETLDLSKQFPVYSDLGFLGSCGSNSEIAQFQVGSFRFLLQGNFYVEEHAGNFMMSLMVEDADEWWDHIERIGLKEKYSLHMAKPPAMQPWGIRVLYLSDPTGVPMAHFRRKGRYNKGRKRGQESIIRNRITYYSTPDPLFWQGTGARRMPCRPVTVQARWPRQGPAGPWPSRIERMRFWATTRRPTRPWR